jgi:mono/diheme cytochrome c family protein
MKRSLSILSLVALAGIAVASPTLAADRAADRKMVERGRYIVTISGCNDCHTPGYAMNNGKVPESEWLTGDQLGWRGPWGTTYATNLRKTMATLSEADWLKLAHNANFRPPMPSPSLRNMSDGDLRAVYRFVRSLGPGGVDAPAYVPPERSPSGPVVMFPAPQ